MHTSLGVRDIAPPAVARSLAPRPRTVALSRGVTPDSFYGLLAGQLYPWSEAEVSFAYWAHKSGRRSTAADRAPISEPPGWRRTRSHPAAEAAAAGRQDAMTMKGDGT
jgi:hypothetical protein